MTREELERMCRELGFEPSADDTDADLFSIINRMNWLTTPV